MIADFISKQKCKIESASLNRVVLAFLATVLVILPLIQGFASAQTLDQCDLEHIYNDTVWYDPCSQTNTSAVVGSVILTGNDNAEKAYNFFLCQGLTPTQAAAIVGNLLQESGVTPTSVNSDSGAYGIVQWLGGRLTDLQNQPNYTDLGVQLAFAWHELTNGYKDVLDALKATNDLATAVDIILRHYEIPCSTSDESCWSAENNNRLYNAGNVIKSYGSGSDCSSNENNSNDIGSGSGQFATNTMALAYPGLDKMLAYAKQVAQTAAGPLPPATQAFCANLANGTCASSCESAAEWVWLGHRGVYADPNSAWPILMAAGHAHPGDRNPPVGALLIYSGTAHGHVAVYLGNNLVFSTDVLGSGSVYIASADKIESAGWNMNYVGWADPYFNGKVGNQGQ